MFLFIFAINTKQERHLLQWYDEIEDEHHDLLEDNLDYSDENDIDEVETEKMDTLSDISVH